MGEEKAKKTMMDIYRSAVTSQLVTALETLRQSISRASVEVWAAEHIDTAVNQVVFHTLFYTDLYLGRGVAEFREQPYHRENPGLFQDYEEWEDRTPTNFYEKTACSVYLDFCVGKVRSVLGAESEETLVGKSGFSWRKTSRVELHIYNLRHIQHHAAQLGLRHQLLGGEPFKWIGAG